MSMSIFLMQYKKAVESDLFSEENSVTLGTSYVSSLVLEQLNEYLNTILIVEEGSTDTYEQQIISNDKIKSLKENIVKICEELFDEYLNKQHTLKEKDSILNEIASLLENRKLLSIKLEKYSENESIFFTVG